MDLAVPDSPAFTVLGLNPNSVERPSSPREFATSLLNGVDNNGNLQTGIAVDTAPFMLFYKDTTLEQYKKETDTRLLSRIMLSFATAKGNTDVDKSVKVALGLRFTPWDEGDPRLDQALIKCLKDSIIDVEISQEREKKALEVEQNSYLLAIEKERDDKKKELLKEKVARLQDQIDKLAKQGTAELNTKAAPAINACRNNKEYKSNLWNKSSWSIGLAPTYTSTTGLENDLKFSGVGIWTSVALQLGGSGQFILYSQYRNKEEVPDSAKTGQFIEQDTFKAGGRLRFGMPDINFNAEAMHVEERNVSVDTKNRKNQYSVGTELKVASNLWLVMNVGSESGNSKGDNISVLGNLKWAFSPEPTIKF